MKTVTFDRELSHYFSGQVWDVQVSMTDDGDAVTVKMPFTWTDKHGDISVRHATVVVDDSTPNRLGALRYMMEHHVLNLYGDEFQAAVSLSDILFYKPSDDWALVKEIAAQFALQSVN